MRQRIKIIKNRSDIGAGTRGSDMGVDAIEIAAINAKDDFFNRYESLDLETDNESVYNKVTNSFAKRIKQVYEQCSRVSRAVHSALNNDLFPIILSGDHSSALGTISGIKSMYPDKSLGVVWIDAHSDIHSPYTSPSGNIHGMPLAAALGIDNKKVQVNKISKETGRYWESLKYMNTDKVKIQPENLIYFGVRDMEEAERSLIDKLNIKAFKVDEIRYRGHETVMCEAINYLSLCEVVYVSFDVDCLDRYSVSDGTGTPVSRGFDQHEVHDIIKYLMSNHKVCAFEVSEVNPLLDKGGNKMAEVAFDVISMVADQIKPSRG